MKTLKIGNFFNFDRFWDRIVFGSFCGRFGTQKHSKTQQDAR